MYADDVVLLSTTAVGLQASLNVLHAFCDLQGLTVNLKKTQVVVFNDKTELSIYSTAHQFFYMGAPLSLVEQYVYLGVVFHRKADFKVAVATLAITAKKAMFGMMRRCAVLGIQDVKLRCQLFDALVMPILSYGCEMWGTSFLTLDCDVLEEVHKLFLRKLLQVKTSTPLFMLYAEVSRFPLRFFWQKQILRFHNRMMDMLESREPRWILSAFQWSRQRTARHIWYVQLQKWLNVAAHTSRSEVAGTGVSDGGTHSSVVVAANTLTQNEHMLNENHVDVPLAGGSTRDSMVVCSSSGTSVSVAPALTTTMQLDVDDIMDAAKLAYITSHTVGASSKIHRYVSIHGGDWESLPDYLTRPLLKKHRVVLTRFRMGAHVLEIETGRWRGVTSQERFCSYCKSQGSFCVEDEYHFLFVCPLYAVLRQRFHGCFRNIPTNLFSVFNSSRDALLASMIHAFFSKRGEFLQHHLQQSCEPGLAP